jgi:drug/metabolite transporter (DMT)-like permease
MPLLAYVLLLLTTLFWGANVVAGKLSLGHISPMFLTTIRWAIALVVLSLIGWPRLRADWYVVRRNAIYLGSLGAVGFAVFNIAVYSAVRFTSGINVSVEQGAVPMLIFLANFLVFRLHITWPQVLGLVLSSAGILLVASHGDPGRILALEFNIGDAIMVAAGAAYARYAVALRNKPTMHWQSLMIAMSAGALLASIPFTAAEIAMGAVVYPDSVGWAVIFFTAIFPSVIAQAFFVKGVELIGANRAGLFINLVPIFGTLLSVLVVNESLRPYHGLAMTLVFGGIWLAETKAAVRKTA